jgi:hypothetical protein
MNNCCGMNNIQYNRCTQYTIISVHPTNESQGELKEEFAGKPRGTI